MDPILFHLRVNHLAIMVLPVAAVLLVLALWKRDVKELWLACAIVPAIAAIGTVASMQSGDAAEHDPRISAAVHELVEKHEGRAKPALGATILALALGWTAFGISHKSGKAPHLALGAGTLAATLLASA